MTNLLPCPFCGPGQSQVDLWFDDMSKRYRVGCGRCGCSTGFDPRDATEAPAIASWNKRPAPPEPIEGMVEAGIKAIRQAMFEGTGMVPPASTYVEEKLVRAVLTAIRTLSLQDHGWQDISTAPKDGTLIIAYAPKAPGEKIRTTWWRRAEDKRRYIGWGEFNMSHWPPTHWKPAPAAPATVAEEGTKS